MFRSILYKIITLQIPLFSLFIWRRLKGEEGIKNHSPFTDNHSPSSYDYAENKGLSLRQVMDFTNSANLLGPSNKAKYAARKAIKNLEYFPDEKVRYLKRFICKREHVGEENIIFGHGSPMNSGKPPDPLYIKAARRLIEPRTSRSAA